MEWASWIWRASSSRWALKSLVGTLALLMVWAVGFGPLVEWRQKVILERLQPVIAEIVEVDQVQPPSPEATP